MVQTGRSEVTIYTQTEVLEGSIFIRKPDARLLDELNENSTIEPDNLDIFSELKDVTIWHADGTEEKSPSVLINKTIVQMAGTNNANLNRGIGAKPEPKPYPYVEKIAVLVSIDMPSYSVTGKMYRIAHQNLENVLQEKVLFMPLTDTYITSLVNGKQWRVSFLAVNKKLIVSLHDWSVVGLETVPR